MGTEGVVVQGQSWVLLGALRLHLLLPADGCDPAAKYGQKRAHLQAKLEDVRLEIEVRGPERMCDDVILEAEFLLVVVAECEQ